MPQLTCLKGGGGRQRAPSCLRSGILLLHGVGQHGYGGTSSSISAIGRGGDLHPKTRGRTATSRPVILATGELLQAQGRARALRLQIRGQRGAH